MIGKMRQAAAVTIDVSAAPAASTAKSRGVLGRLPSLEVVVTRLSPPPALASFIQHYWTVGWDLRGREPHLQETLPHPNTYLVYEFDKLTVHGVSTHKFSRLLEGQSRTFGVKFQPGGLWPFLRTPVSALTDRLLPATEIFGQTAETLQNALALADDEAAMAALMSTFFLSQEASANENVSRATALVLQILEEPRIKTVDDLVCRSGVSRRSLQRLFRDYVGVSPKWVIRRYRLHELVERINRGGQFDWAEVALDLGYFDQAHLINDFRSIVGYSPSQLQRQVSKPSSS